MATAELGGAVTVSLLALFAPSVALLAVVLVCWLAVRMMRKWRRRSEPPADTAPRRY